SVGRAALLGYADAVSPTLRPRLEALTGVAMTAPADHTLELAAPIQLERPPANVARRGGQVTPVPTVDDLIELAAALLEDQGTGDDAERFLDGVSRLWPEQASGFERRTGALAKRAEELTQFNRLVMGIGGSEIVARVILAWTRGMMPPKRTTGDLI